MERRLAAILAADVVAMVAQLLAAPIFATALGQS